MANQIEGDDTRNCDCSIDNDAFRKINWRFCRKISNIKNAVFIFSDFSWDGISWRSLDFHIPKGYIYFAMGFSIVVEMINIKMRKRLISKP